MSGSSFEITYLCRFLPLHIQGQHALLTHKYGPHILGILFLDIYLFYSSKSFKPILLRSLTSCPHACHLIFPLGAEDDVT